MDEKLPMLIRMADLSAIGVSRYRLSLLVDQGSYEKVAPGVFAKVGEIDDTTAGLLSVAARRPDATLCLLSALAAHELTDEIPARSDVALPRGAHRLTVRNAPIAWHFFDAHTFYVGRSSHRLIKDLAIGMYGPERTIIDTYRLRHKMGADLATEALKRWLRRRGSSPARLMDMVEHFPAARPAIGAALEVLI